VKFCSNIWKIIICLIKKLFPEEPAEILVRTGQDAEVRVPEYVLNAFRYPPDGYLTPYQVAIHHPVADKNLSKAMRETLNEVERLLTAGWLEVSKKQWPLKKVMIPKQISQLLEQELSLSEGERKERFGLLHGRLEGDGAYLEDATENAILEEKGFFKTRIFRELSFNVKPCQMIGRNLDSWLGLNKREIIGTYHTHLIPYCRTPSMEDMAMLMANPGKPHLIICRWGLFAYTFKSFRKILVTYPVKTCLDIVKY
jgi:proteasome lid subunit RPN8/RPN11